MENHKPYRLRMGHPPDFMVEYEILSKEQGGRKMPVYQGIRWDLWYEDEGHKGDYLFMVWPEFIDRQGEIIIQREDPVTTKGKAVLWIINESMRSYHQQRITVGMRCCAREGGTTVAEYRVVEILGLMTNPTTKRTKE